MLTKLDPARRGIIWGCMTAEEHGFFEDARDVGATIYFNDGVWSRHDSGYMRLFTAYWTNWERPQEPDKPRFRLFRIDWQTYSYPTVTVDVGGYHFSDRDGCEIGDLIKRDGKRYRIFGYTDNAAWADWGAFSEKYNDSSYMPPYTREACDHRSNRKYAIGRLGAGNKEDEG